VRHAVVLGDRRPHLGLLVAVEEVDEAVQSGVRALVDRLNHGECASHPIKRVMVVRDSFTPENGLLTANLKLSRKNIAERYERALFC
jgi:long-subunit acyl-CoA synthetase (AMP-forming)